MYETWLIISSTALGALVTHLWWVRHLVKKAHSNYLIILEGNPYYVIPDDDFYLHHLPSKKYRK